MSEQFLRVPVKMIRALSIAERTFPGIGMRVQEAWLLLHDLPPETNHGAGFSAGEIALLEALGVLVGGQIRAISEDIVRLRKYRENASNAGRRSASVRLNRRSTNRSTNRSTVRSTDRQQTVERGNGLSTNRSTDFQPEVRSQKYIQKTEDISSVGSFGADAPTEPPSLPVDRENASPGVALVSMRELSDAMCEDFAQTRSGKYLWSRVDGIQLARLRKAATDAEILERWRRGLTAHGWQQVSTVAQLAQKWNDLAPSGLAGTGEIRAVEGSL